MAVLGPDPDQLPPGWNETRPPRWLPRAVLAAAIGVAGFMVAQYLFVKLSDLLTILLVSLFLSFAVEPAVDYLAERGWRRGSATGLVFVVLLVLSTVLVWVVVDLVIQQVRTLVNDSPDLVKDATDWVNKRFDANITTDKIVEQLRKYQGDLASTAGDLGGRVVSVTGSVLGVVFNIFTIGLFSFYLVADGPRFRRSICSVLPPERQRLVLGLWELAITRRAGTSTPACCSPRSLQHRRGSPSRSSECRPRSRSHCGWVSSRSSCPSSAPTSEERSRS